METSELIDPVYRSRHVILDMLESREYITTPYRNFSPKEIAYMLNSTNGEALRMDLTHKDGQHKCVVLYSKSKLKQKLRTYLETLNDPEKADYLDPTIYEIIIIVMEPVVDTFHKTVLENYVKHKSKVFIFHAHTLVNDPSKHYLLRTAKGEYTHQKVPAEEHAELLKTWCMKSKIQLPIIRYHEDMQARYMGLLPGDIVKITRASPSAGEYILYRVCVP